MPAIGRPELPGQLDATISSRAVEGGLWLKAEAAHAVGETRIEMQALEQWFYFHVPQPDLVLLISFFQAVQGLILLSLQRR